MCFALTVRLARALTHSPHVYSVLTALLRVILEALFRFMRCVVGTESGALKVVSRRKTSSLGEEEMKLDRMWTLDKDDIHRSASVEVMCAGRYPGEVVIGLSKGTIMFKDVINGYSPCMPLLGKASKEEKFEDAFSDGPLQKPKQLPRFIGLDCRSDRLISCSEEGRVCMFDVSGVELLKRELEGGAVFDVAPVKMNSAFEEFAIQGPIERARLHPHHWWLAFGGKENDLKMYDVERDAYVWKAKNVPNDFLDLRVPVWVKDMAWMPKDTNTMVIGTGYHQIRTYDIRQGRRRPVFNKEFGSKPIVRVAGSDAWRVFFADTLGTISEVDLRTGHIVGGYKGCGGAVRDLQVFEMEGADPLLLSCGLDRALVVHTIKKRRLLGKLYLKQYLNCLHAFEYTEEAGAAGTVDSSAVKREPKERAVDVLWDQLDEVVDTPVRVEGQTTSELPGKRKKDTKSKNKARTAVKKSRLGRRHQPVVSVTIEDDG